MIDRCSFCDRFDVPLVRAKDAATCADCARLALEILSPPSTTRGFSVMCDCNDSSPERCGGIGGWRTGPIEAGGTDVADPCDCPCHGDLS